MLKVPSLSQDFCKMTSTRLVIKNLPHYCTPERLRQHFEGASAPGGKLTDVKVSFKSDGTSRRFGFVGYKTADEASKARDYFDKTFIDSARISVSIVEAQPDASQRPNKRRRMDEGRSQTGANAVVLSEPSSSTPLDEFMQVMRPRNKGPSWANEDTVHQPTVPEPESEQASPPEQEGLSDMEWMRRRITGKVDEVDTAVFEQSDDEDAPKLKPIVEVVTEATSEPTNDVEDIIRQTARLFVRNLTFSCTEEELLEIFNPYGSIAKTHIPIDMSTKQGKGMAYVTYVSSNDAVSAYRTLDKKPFQGRLLHILGAVDRKGKTEVLEAGGKQKTVKEEKAAKRKALAGKEFNWSMLYMNSDAVASSIADRMNIPKTAILNPEPSESTTNPAVRLALAETHIITETKTFLESNGVVLSSFTTKARSDTIILVKNIPYGTTEEQIREMFEPHGELSRVLVPPAGTIAVVEFANPEEAAKALKAVAYRRLGNSIVYLERGPVGMFAERHDEDGVVNEDDRELLSKTIIKAPLAHPADAENSDSTGASASVARGTTLYVKNLSFATTQEKLVQLFSHLPSFSFARVQTKADPKRPGVRLSMGYGFIGFKDVEGATKAMKSLQGFVVDGHELSVKVAGRGREEMEKEAGLVGSRARTTKIIVKNVPFEATKKDIKDLFASHGKLKSVRLPKKFDAKTRGFAFLEFISRHEAENAFNALKHTHLLGRHLVLEWATEEEQDLDVLRRKAGVGVGLGVDGIGLGGDGTKLAVPGRKRKLDMGRNDVDPEDMDV